MRALEQLAEVPVAEVARRMGMTVHPSRGIGPCPACSAERRSRSDKRLPVSPWSRTSAAKWTCFSCNQSGGTVGFVSFGLFGVELASGDDRWRELLDWAERQGLILSRAGRRS